jgi:hypothetical protein
MLLIVISVCGVTSSILAERAITLARVRQTDFDIIAELLAANSTPGFGSIGVERVSEAFNQLNGGADLRNLRIGLLLERDGEILASNVGDRSIADVTEELSLGPQAVETRILGNDTVLTAIFPDRKYSFYAGNGRFGPTPWHWEFSVPFRQLVDGRLDQGVILPKAGTALRIMILSGLFLLCIWLLWEYRTNRKVRKLEDTLQASRIKERNCQKNAHDLKLRLQQAKELSANEKKNIENEHLEYMLKAEELELVNKRLEQEKDNASQQGILSGNKEVAERLLDNIWLDLEWHDKAKKEALGLYMKTGQPGEKRQLSKFFGQIVENGRMPEDWTAFRNTVWHNPGRQQAKLYCSRIDGTITVIAVDSGKGRHKRFDGGKKLLQRHESMKNIFRRAS